ncbi:MAG: nucleotidyltransferase [Candidatus Levybacteria bacterium]|nr:nucleotidyltransferase [Candidatus Levybacteria bacterium]
MSPHEKPKTGKTKDKAEAFYKELLRFLLQKKLPFMVSGTYAFTVYTDIQRDTKDIDIVTTQEDYPRILQTLHAAGYETKLHELELDWLAKVYKDDFFTDILYAERNGLHKVDATWLDNAHDAEVLGLKVKLVPPEELIRSKAYIQGRHRFDGPDVIHLILKQGKTLDWKLLIQKMDPHWEVLAGHLISFLFVYPSERKVIPNWVIEHIAQKAVERLSHEPTTTRITRGLLFSPEDYAAGVEKWGFMPIKTLD